jgi:heparin binding hemagglutinin HbhA
MTSTPFNVDATKPFFAWVGAAELAVEKLRETAADVHERDIRAYATQVGTQLSEAFDELVEELHDELGTLPRSAQERLGKLPSELKALPKRLESLIEDARDLPRAAQARLEGLQAEAKGFRGRVETVVETQRSTFADLAEEYVEAFEELAVRGRAFVAKLRDDSISGDVEIIVPDAEVVKDVSPTVEKAAAEAAAVAAVPAAKPAVTKPAAKKAATTKKAPAARKPAANKATGTKKPTA